MRSNLFGTDLPRTEYERHHNVTRTVVGDTETSAAGNVVVEIGHENSPEGTWTKTEHLVLTPSEALVFTDEILRRAGFKS